MIAATTPRPQNTVRRVNDLIWQSLARHAEPIAFFCECSNRRCDQVVCLTPTDYELARSDAAWAALAPGHPVEPLTSTV